MRAAVVTIVLTGIVALIWPATTAVVGVLVLTGQTQAEDMTAGELLAYCKKSEAEGSFCATYIAGFVEGVSYGRMQTDMMRAVCLPPDISDAQRAALRQRFIAEAGNGILNTSASTVQTMPALYVLSSELQDIFPCPAGSSDHSAEPLPAAAHPYDDCILEHMGTAQNEAATFAVERACISKTSIAIPDVRFADAKAWAGYFNVINSWNYGLLVRITNSTPFNITELILVAHDRKTNKTNEYVIDNFDEPLDGPGLITKLPEPAYRNMIPTGKTRSFFVPASEVTKDTVNDFFKRFDWDLRLSRGIPSK